MTDRSALHATFVIERTYPAAPARVFAAWTDRRAKARWFSGAEEPDPAYALDFRLGGREAITGGPPGGPVYAYEAIYRDIVADQRIVYAYSMDKDGRRISVSLATVEFHPAGEGTRLVLTEQGVYLDGGDRPEIREGGVAAQLDALGGVLTG
jgi:uncharacterized protein YndB with AHSA1/START domain